MTQDALQVDIVSIFPEVFEAPLDTGIIRRAREAGLVSIHTHDLRDWTSDKHRSVDDAPYGGGAGMVMRPEPWFGAIESLRETALHEGRPGGRTVLLTPQGRPLTQMIAQELADEPRLILMAVRYEGIDERVREHLVDDEISIGDFVLSGGEIPAMVVVDAVVRLLPGALGSARSLDEESFQDGLLEYPHYTRPPEFRGWGIPTVLLSGNHAEIAAWRRAERLRRTAVRRPDLFAQANLTRMERVNLQEDAEE
jgi:tRNA (guanine37-N1)-methyltransferase